MTDKIAAEVDRLTAERSHIERQPLPVAERFGAVERKLRAAETYYRTYGLPDGAAHSPEAERRAQQAMLGALMVANGPALHKAERQRLEAAGEGIAPPERAKTLAALSAQILKLSAQRELQLRKTEGAGEFLARPIHPELAVFKQLAVELLAK